MWTFISKEEQALTTCLLHCPRNQTPAEFSCHTLIFIVLFLRVMTSKTYLTFSMPFSLSPDAGTGNGPWPCFAEQQRAFRAFTYSNTYSKGK